MREPSAVIGRGIACGERAETDLYAFISKRHEQRVVVEGERAVEEARRVSERHQEAPAGGQRTTPGLALAMCRHLQQGVYARRSVEWGRQEDELEDREANQPKGEDAA